MFARARQPQHSKAGDFQQAVATNAASTPDVNLQAFPQAAQHNCLAAHTVLKRKGNGLPSATATYTALRKAALGGSLLPEHGPTADQPGFNVHHNNQQVCFVCNVENNLSQLLLSVQPRSAEPSYTVSTAQYTLADA